ncbi:MXAN_6640 family putative metalloprotease [Nocardioides piscis]|uniref:Uncharacterized protein n=1 Tax=Nocardioides piscis TaxID=2714938 RepID=A0A6G7YGD8_9ACTN|nr:MXAN_6640 family putative metalloprotease [Nocardioides piscis]QIK75863.1 hypothetical protein G7071_10830 [Nocardioides piscis]
MRRTTRSAVLFGALLVVVLSSLPVATADPAADLPDPAARRSMAALDTAERVLAGEARPTDPSATLALRDLWLSRPDLAEGEEDEADALLARPTDGAADPHGNGYTVPATSTCGPTTCIHHVATTADAPPSADWVSLTLATMERVHDREVEQLGFRPPVSDGTAGGDARVDVYLKDLGTGLYGYCAAEKRVSGRTASGFCVLDNDYSNEQFPSPTTPEQDLAVTAAHEFFHAVQFAYDYTEDPWMLESTATWMEEQVADDVNDNRQYLRYSQLRAPFVPLDAVSSTYGFQYGNWIFWEYLSQRFGPGIVKRVWRAAPRRYSLAAINNALSRKRQTLPEVYADFAAANTHPLDSYAEAPGVPEFAPAPALADVTLTRATRRHKERASIDHLASETVHVRPAAELTGRRWRLRVAVRGPRSPVVGAARLVLHRVDGTVATRRLRFNKRGRAVQRAPFAASKVVAVTISIVNASTRFRCGRQTDFACRGIARDDDERFTVVATAIRTRKRR